MLKKIAISIAILLGLGVLFIALAPYREGPGKLPSEARSIALHSEVELITRFNKGRSDFRIPPAFSANLPWVNFSGHQLRVMPLGENVLLRSAAEDMTFNTSDDYEKIFPLKADN